VLIPPDISRATDNDGFFFLTVTETKDYKPQQLVCLFSVLKKKKVSLSEAT